MYTANLRLLISAMLAVSGLEHDLSEPISSPLTSLDSDEELDDWEPAWKLYPYGGTINGHAEKENTPTETEETTKQLESKNSKSVKTNARRPLTTNGTKKRTIVSTRGEASREAIVNSTEEDEQEEDDAEDEGDCDGDDDEDGGNSMVTDSNGATSTRGNNNADTLNGHVNGTGRRFTGKRGRTKTTRNTRTTKQSSINGLETSLVNHHNQHHNSGSSNSSSNSNHEDHHNSNITTAAANTATNTTTTRSNSVNHRTSRSTPGTPSGRSSRRGTSEPTDSIFNGATSRSRDREEVEDVELDANEQKRAQQAINEMNRLEQAFCLLRKRVYYEKLVRLQQEELLIREGHHPLFLDQLPSVEEKHTCNMRTVEAKRQHLIANALNMFEARKYQAECHFETQKWALRRSITERIHACRVQLAEERFQTIEPLPGPAYDARSSAGP
ncbi:hypothetical protein BDF22DRAFT_675609 [Syncephalis plumigaleata]|nr:hypothetical protein BDF22DRAFT_675609 [Syncephalis plumigaleata]